MARDFVSELTALADGVRQAQALVDRKNDLERSCADAASRLEKLRGQVDVALKDRADAERQAQQAQDAAKDFALGIQVQANAEREAKLAECESECAKRRAAADAFWKRCQVEVDDKRAAVAALEAEETRLAQSVAKLTEELAALRTRVGL